MPDQPSDLDASPEHDATPATEPSNGSGRATRRRTARSRHWKLIRRGVAVVMVALLVPTVWSYAQALTAPGTDPWAARSVEWLRDHGMNGVVNTVENWWFTKHAPPVGGRPEPPPRRATGAGACLPRTRPGCSRTGGGTAPGSGRT